MTQVRFIVQVKLKGGAWQNSFANHLSGLPVSLISGKEWILNRRKTSDKNQYRLVREEITETVVF